MGARWRKFLMAGAGIVLAGTGCRAEALLFPNGTRQPGDLGALMGGGWSALAGGAEAAFYNPAGLAAEPGTIASAGADLFRYQTSSVAGESTERIDGAPGYLAVAWGPSRRTEGVATGVGVFAHWPLARDISVSHSSQDTVDSSAVPDAIDPGGLDAFTNGIPREIRSSGSGSLWVLSTGVAAGIRFRSWLRAGAGLAFERAQFSERSASLTSYRAENDGSAHESYEASVQAEARYLGRANRLVPLAGFQLRPFPGIAFGVSARLPSRDLGGNGSVFLGRTSRASFQSGTDIGTSLNELILAEDDGLQFRLRTPLEVTFGAGFAGHRYALELDIIRTHGVDTYTVLPGTESAPPSTVAYLAPDLRTGARPLTRWAFGGAYSVTDSTVAGLGIRDDTSDVRSGDAVFRRVHLYSVSPGVILRDGRMTASLGVIYQFAPRQSVSFPAPAGESQTDYPVSFDELTIRLGASWVL